MSKWEGKDQKFAEFYTAIFLPHVDVCGDPNQINNYNEYMSCDIFLLGSKKWKKTIES